MNDERDSSRGSRRSNGSCFPAAALVLSCFCLLAAACAPSVIVKRWPESGRRLRVAVLPFRPDPAAANSGALATEAFSSSILSVDAYDVLERGAMDNLLKEQQLGQTGLLDESKAVEIGKLLGADAVVLGAVTEFRERNYLLFPPSSVALSARMVDVKTGLVEWSATHRVGGNERWLILPLYPLFPIVALLSPTADEQMQRAAKMICKELPKRARAVR
ncbi:MAG: GNA1162 family protein [Elusimicrobiota bacterium]|jgi:hypothetical protein